MPRPSERLNERLKNMKRPTAASQGVSPQVPQPKSPQPKRTQPTVKLQTVKTFKQLASRLAGFKLPQPTATEKSATEKSVIEKNVIEKNVAGMSTVRAKGAPHEEPTVLSKAVFSKAVISKVPSAEVTPAANLSIPYLPFIKDSKGSRIAFNLLLVRPWVLVVGFWILSLAGASLAIEGLVNPRKLNMALPEAAVEVTPVASKSALINVEQDTEATTAEATAANTTAAKRETGPASAATAAQSAAQSNPGAPAERASRSSSVPILTLGALVGTCAAGCLVISRRRAMMRIAAARARGRMRRANAANVVNTKADVIAPIGKTNLSKPGQKIVARKAPPAKTNRPLVAKLAMAATSLATTSLAAAKPVASSARALSARPTAAHPKKRRQRTHPSAVNQSSVSQPSVSQSVASGDRVIVSRSTAQQAAQNAAPKAAPKTGGASSKRHIRRRTPSRIASRRQAVVSVMPANESHALDWANGSLAHQMDVRPQRTASM
jgi:hypothetical protein